MLPLIPNYVKKNYAAIVVNYVFYEDVPLTKEEVLLSEVHYNIYDLRSETSLSLCNILGKQGSYFARNH